MRINTASKYRRRRLVVFSGLGLVLGMVGYLPLTLLAPVGAMTAEVQPYEAPLIEEPTIEWPSNAATAIGAVEFPGVLASTGTDEPRSIASITKVITALVVLDAHPLTAGDAGPTITFTAQDGRYYNDYLSVGGMVKPAWAGITLSQREVMQVMLISSANNYAKSLAVWGFGSVDAFTSATQDWLAEKGLTSTVIHEPSGMDPRNVSTAAELLELAKLAIADPTVSEIVATEKVSVPHVGTIENSNRLLGDLGIDGIKTGTLNAAGACLLFSADVLVGDSSVTLVGVALGGVDHRTQFPQVRELMESVADDFHEVVVVGEGDVLASYQTGWGSEAHAVAGASHSQLVWGPPTITAEVTPAALGVTASGTFAGVARFTVNGEVAEIPLKLKGSIDDPGPVWRLSNPFGMAG